MNISELDDSLSVAINALAAAQAVIRKGAASRDLDVLRKSDLLAPTERTASPAADALAKLADAFARVDRLEAERQPLPLPMRGSADREAAADMDAQHRKTWAPNPGSDLDALGRNLEATR